jgi:hypothetical protein
MDGAIAEDYRRPMMSDGMTDGSIQHGAYRNASATGAALRPASVLFPRNLEECWIGDAVYVSNGGEVMQPRFVGAAIALCIIGLGPVIGLAIALASGEPDAARVMAIFSAICAPLCGWAWWASRRLVKINAMINAGDHEGAGRILGEKKSASFGLAIGLLAQLHGSQQKAATAYRWVTSNLELPRSVPVPVTLQAYPREAIARTNLGEFQEAATRLARVRNAGAYCNTLSMVASVYLCLAVGQPLFPGGTADAARMADHFRKIRGSWGGLALAGCGYRQLGDQAMCDTLLAEERSRAHFDRLQTFLPLLTRVMSSG